MDYAETRANILQTARALKFNLITARYDGCGDQGNIDEIEISPPYELDATNTEELMDFLWEVVYTKFPGLEINEGSFGEIKWNIVTDKIAIDENERIMKIVNTVVEDL